jgi:hypothetical protein
VEGEILPCLTNDSHETIWFGSCTLPSNRICKRSHAQHKLLVHGANSVSAFRVAQTEAPVQLACTHVRVWRTFGGKCSAVFLTTFANGPAVMDECWLLCMRRLLQQWPGGLTSSHDWDRLMGPALAWRIHKLLSCVCQDACNLSARTRAFVRMFEGCPTCSAGETGAPV